MKKNLLVGLVVANFLFACSTNTETPDPSVSENPTGFQEITQIDLGNAGASEISAYDSKTKRLFVVNNDGASKIDVLDLSKFPTVTKIQSIDISVFGAVNSVAAFNGLLAAGVEGINKQDNGKILVYNTESLSLTKQITAGAMPDMVTFSPNGQYILSANEGEPNTDYSLDPVGSVSIINTSDFSVTTLDFSGFVAQRNDLAKKDFRIFGKNASFIQDIEPEYIAISDDSKTAWVSLQENNGIARIDLNNKSISAIFPLGSKDFNNPKNALDASDKDNKINLANWNVKGLYQPDAIGFFLVNNMPYIISANEGDAREYTGFAENKRLKDIALDARFDAANLKIESNLGRLNVSTVSGNTDSDPELEEIYVVGGRSFSIWEGNTGNLIYDCGKELEEKIIAMGQYDDNRSDDKGVEPEGVAVASLNNKTIAFIGLERADAVAVYDVSSPANPQFLQSLKTGDAPEGVLFIKANQSPNGKSMLVVSSETDGTVKFYQTNNLK